MHRKIAVSLLAGLAALSLAAQSLPRQNSGWTLLAAPSFTLPLTSGSFGANELFSSAWGGTMGAEYSPSDFRLGSAAAALRMDAGYSAGGFLQAEGSALPGSLREASFLAGPGLSLPIASAISVRAFAEGGAAWGSLSTGTSSVYGLARAGLGLDAGFGTGFSSRLEVAWTHKFGLYGGLAATLGLGWSIPAPAGSGNAAPRLRLLEFSALDARNVFPILRSYYDEHPLGTARIVNTGKVAARDIKVSYIIRQYMDAPKECAAIKTLEPGQTVEVKLNAIFNDRILAVTEATKVSAEVFVEYGEGGSLSKAATVTVYDRNALTWADDRTAAAFVSSKDPWVLDLCGNIIAAVKSARNPEIAKNLQTAIAIHEGLRSFGLGYALSPNRPFAQAVVNTEVVDSLKFPRQTLGYRSGDCADLSVLYASCFEAVGIETAFITVPGHIFMAVDLGMGLQDLKARSMDESAFVVQDGKVWLPIETTLRDAGFLEVWKKAASEWREASSRGVAAVFPVHEAWKLYAPVGLPADGSTVFAPAQDVLVRGFQSELARAIDAELGPRIAALGASQGKAGVSAKATNDLGVLYGKYGKYADAERQFQAAAKQGYVASVVNLGNIAWMKTDMAGALVQYQQAAKASPDNARIQVALARAAAALGKTDLVTATLATLRRLDPGAAEQYVGLAAESSAAGAAGTRAAAQAEGGPSWL